MQELRIAIGRRGFGITIAIGWPASPVPVGDTVMMMNGRTAVDASLRRGILPEMAELSLLLPVWQMQKLADLAQAQGVSVGKYLRDLITNSVPMSNATNN
jgi:hypothetical protein